MKMLSKNDRLNNILHSRDKISYRFCNLCRQLIWNEFFSLTQQSHENNPPISKSHKQNKDHVRRRIRSRFDYHRILQFEPSWWLYYQRINFRIFFNPQRRTCQLVFKSSIYGSSLFNGSWVYDVDVGGKRGNVAITLANKTGPTTLQQLVRRNQIHRKK